MMDYKELVKVYENIDGTSKRLNKTYYISELIKKTPDDSLEMTLLLLKGNLYPGWDKQDIGVASKLVLKAISSAAGIPANKIENKWKELGDLGECAKEFITSKKQMTLFSHKLSLKKVFDELRKLATISGSGAVSRKIKVITGLLTSASPDEAKYIVRTVLEDLRMGVGEGTIRDSIIWSSIEGLDIDFTVGNKTFEYNISKGLERKLGLDGKKAYVKCVNLIQSAQDIKNDFAEVVGIVRKKGIKGLEDVRIKVGNPMKVMLYQKAKGIKDAFETVGKPAALEYKYDGFRLQIHCSGSGITLFTRRLDDVTKQFPDIVKAVKKDVNVKSCIFDAEVVGYNKKTKKYLPFQSISQRIRRKYNIHDMAIKFPVELNIFDILYCNGDNLLKTPFSERREILNKIVNEEKFKIVLSKQLITSDEKEAEKFYKESLKAGEEGIMVKNLKAPYKPGSRVGYGVKVKPVMETLDLVIVGAEWGKGKRKGWMSSFKIACRDKNGEFLGIGKVGTGIKELEGEGDVTFAKLTKLLKPYILSEKGTSVSVTPKFVIEINYEEIQKSPTYSSGYALRFPRVLQIREDKPVEETSSLEYVEDLYVKQK